MKWREKEPHGNYLTSKLPKMVIRFDGNIRRCAICDRRRKSFMPALLGWCCFCSCMFNRDAEGFRAHTCTHPQYVHANYTPWVTWSPQNAPMHTFRRTGNTCSRIKYLALRHRLRLPAPHSRFPNRQFSAGEYFSLVAILVWKYSYSLSIYQPFPKSSLRKTVVILGWRIFLTCCDSSLEIFLFSLYLSVYLYLSILS